MISVGQSHGELQYFVWFQNPHDKNVLWSSAPRTLAQAIEYVKRLEGTYNHKYIIREVHLGEIVYRTNDQNN